MLNNKIYSNFFGFDDMFSKMEKLINMDIPKYPPFNIVKKSDKEYVLEFAVAGFGKSDVSVIMDGNNLVIEGAVSESDDSTDYIYKGLASRAFKRSFTVSDKIEVKDAELVNGILKVTLENLNNLQENIKKIEVK